MFKRITICLLLFLSLSFSVWAEQPLSSVQEQAILEFIKAEFPEQYKAAQALKEQNPAYYQQQLNIYKSLKEYYENLKKNNPEAFERLQALKNAL